MGYRSLDSSDPIGPPAASARRDGAGRLELAVLRSRATIRAAVLQSGLSLTALEQGFPTLGSWEGGGQRRAFPAIARGEVIVDPDGRALFFDPIAEKQLPLWEEVFLHYNEAKLAHYNPFFRALDQSALEAKELRDAFAQMPLPVQLMRRTPRQTTPGGKWKAVEKGFTAALVRQLVALGGPFELGLALLVARFFREAGHHEDLLHCHRDVMAAMDGPKIRRFFGTDLPEVLERAREILALGGTGYEELLNEPSPSWHETVQPVCDPLPKFVVLPSGAITFFG